MKLSNIDWPFNIACLIIILVPVATLGTRRHDTQHNDTLHNDIQHNDTRKKNSTLSIMTLSILTLSIKTLCIMTLSIMTSRNNNKKCDTQSNNKKCDTQNKPKNVILCIMTHKTITILYHWVSYILSITNMPFMLNVNVMIILAPGKYLLSNLNIRM
jgi:hypothetical protein